MMDNIDDLIASMESLSISKPKNLITKISTTCKLKQKCNWKPMNNNTKKGVTATTFQVCCKDNCKFIAKYQYNESPFFYKGLDREIRIQDKLSNYNIAPKIYDVVVCGHEAIIIMDKLDITLQEYIHILRKNKQKPIQILQQLYHQSIAIVSNIHILRINHQDLHPGNIMFNLDPLGQPIINSLRIIDYGNSTDTSKYIGELDNNALYGMWKSIIDDLHIKKSEWQI